MASTEKAPDALRTIGEVAEDLRIATHVLRFWEGKFPQIDPQKRRGRRYYRPEDIRLIRHIKGMLYDQGLTIKGVQKHFLDNKELIKRISQGDIATPANDPFKQDLFGNFINQIPQYTPETGDNNNHPPSIRAEDLESLRTILQNMQTLKNRLL
jgi:DNA-binding transcriptional MerR regulator